MKIKTALYLLVASFGLLGLAVAGNQKPERAAVGEIQPSASEKKSWLREP